METPFKQSDLTIEEQKVAQRFYNDITELLKFQNCATPKLFNWLFEERGEYLWELFVTKGNREILKFLNLCDTSVKITLVCNLTKENNTNGTENNLYIHI